MQIAADPIHVYQVKEIRTAEQKKAETDRYNDIYRDTDCTKQLDNEVPRKKDWG